jgi:hypothetical protein
MIAVGQRWREVKTGRIIIVLQARYRDIGPAWHYEDEPPGDWHYRHHRAFGEWAMFTLLGPRAHTIKS